MVAVLDLVKKVDVVPYPHELEYTKFKNNVYTLISHDGSFQLGYLIVPIVDALKQQPGSFVVDDVERTVKLDSSLNEISLREEMFAQLGETWKTESKFETLKGWRNEKYTIYDPSKKPYFNLERSMCPLFGVVMYGVHINGYVKDSSAQYKLWVPRRAADKATYPGMLDNTVAGGLGYPYGPLETVFKECYEEAGLERKYLEKRIKACGVVSYLYQLKPFEFSNELGLVQPEVEYIYDIEMDPTTKPYPVDHESEDFQLMDIETIKEKLFKGEFKDNCGAIILDFMIRHSLITPETEPDYIEITNRLHRFLPFPVKGN